MKCIAQSLTYSAGLPLLARNLFRADKNVEVDKSETNLNRIGRVEKKIKIAM